MYERKTQPLLPRRLFYSRLLKHFLFSLLLMFASLGIGVVGYHGLEGLPWLDALLNASMILGGMGPVDRLATDGGKLFASVYAIYSGVVFLVGTGIMVAPFVHRMLHHLHLEDDNDNP